MRAQDQRRDGSIDWHVACPKRLSDNDAAYADPLDLLAELREDNQGAARRYA